MDRAGGASFVPAILAKDHRSIQAPSMLDMKYNS